MIDATQEQKKAYCAQLEANLVGIGEEGFRELCEELGWDYEDIQGDDVANKAHFWIDDLEKNYKSIPALVEKGERLSPDLRWDDPTQVERTAPHRYYIASSRKERTIVEELVIKNDLQFGRTYKPWEADYLIFDLDKPPENWIKYVGMQEHLFRVKPYYETTIFVQREQCQESCDIQLDGTTILSILRKLYPDNYQFNLAKTVDEMLRKLVTLEENRGIRARIEKWANIQAIASQRFA